MLIAIVQELVVNNLAASKLAQYFEGEPYDESDKGDRFGRPFFPYSSVL